MMRYKKLLSAPFVYCNLAVICSCGSVLSTDPYQVNSQTSVKPYNKKSAVDAIITSTPVPTVIPYASVTPVPTAIITVVPDPTVTPTPTVVSEKSVTLMVASDVQSGAWSKTSIFEKTAQVIEKENPDYVISAGDLSNDSGTAFDYQQFDKAWGRFKDKILAVPGNHDYYVSGANPFFDYFNGLSSVKGIPEAGTHTGDRGKGYFATDVGGWTVVGLNWYASSSKTYQASDEQMLWLEETMKKKPAGRPVLFYSHAPRYTNAIGHSENSGKVSVAWNIMLKYKPDVKIFIGGHLNGVYERWKPMDNNKKYDVNGIRSFMSATGGGGSYMAGSTDDLLESTAKVYGAMKLVLRPQGYDWEFKPIEGSTFSDKGNFDF